MQAISEPKLIPRRFQPRTSPDPRHWTLLILICMLAISAVGLYGSALYFVYTASHHRVVKLLHTPAELGLKGESVDLVSSDGIPLKGWWIPAEPARGAVLVLHGMDGLDASCLLPHAKFLVPAGWSTFVLDMRAHGRSGGDRIGFSLDEPRDVSAALYWLDTQPSLKGKPLVLLGLSMGGATAISTAAMHHNVDALISVSSFASFEPMMGQGLQLWASRLAMLTLFHVWPLHAQPVDHIAQISPRPVLIMHGTADKQVPVQDAFLLKQAGGPAVELWIAKDADHLVFDMDGSSDSPEDVAYRTHVLQFLEKIKH